LVVLLMIMALGELVTPLAICATISIVLPAPIVKTLALETPSTLVSSPLGRYDRPQHGCVPCAVDV
jgi:hypothetical protein